MLTLLRPVSTYRLSHLWRRRLLSLQSLRQMQCKPVNQGVGRARLQLMLETSVLMSAVERRRTKAQDETRKEVTLLTLKKRRKIARMTMKKTTRMMKTMQMLPRRARKTELELNR